MITLENLHEHSIPLSEHPLKWMFYDEDKAPSQEHLDQVIALTPEAARFLWKLESAIFGDVHATKFFRDTEELSFGDGDESKVKKWLYHRGIPFDSKVFYSTQPDWGFILTWKMVIHYSADLFFGHDVRAWDRTLNWALEYDHNDYFIFGKNRIYDGQEEKLKYLELVNKINRDIEERKNRTS